MKRTLLTLPLLFIPFSMLVVVLLSLLMSKILNMPTDAEPFSSIISILIILVLASDVLFVIFLTIFACKDKGYNAKGYALGLFLTKVIQIPLFVVSIFAWVMGLASWLEGGAAPLLIIILFPLFIYIEIFSAIIANIPAISIYIRAMVRKELPIPLGIFTILFSDVFFVDVIFTLIAFIRIKRSAKQTQELAIEE